MTTVLLRSLSIEIVLLILGIFPGSSTDHLGCEFSLELYSFRCILSPLSHLVSFNGLNIQMLSFFVLINGLFIVDIHTWVLYKLVKICLIFVNRVFRDSLEISACLFDPLLLHSFAHANLSDLFADSFFHGSHTDSLTLLHFGDELKLRRSI